MNNERLETACVHMVNCAKGHATTTSALLSFASNPSTILISLQEPAIEHNQLPPSNPDFHLLTPVPECPLCATYVRRLPGVQADIIFTHSNSFLGTQISFPASPAFTIYNFYSPGRPHAIANLLPQFRPKLAPIIMAYLNAHHPWWGSTSMLDDNQIRSYRTETDSIVDWMETHSFFLCNKPGTLMHFPRNGISLSVIDLCFLAGNVTKDILAYEINPDSTSDHAICTLYINHTPPATSPKRAWHRADWALFQQTIIASRLDLSNIGSAEEALRMANNITEIIHTATDAAVPWVKQRAKQSPC
jgi:hypothetical protein